MRFKGLDLNLLVVLEAVLSAKNVTRASERVHLSQSATSSALARLRAYLDDELLVQSGREMRLTRRAQELLPIVRSLLVDVDNKIIAGGQFEPHNADRHIRIMASDYVIAVALARGIDTISRLAPNITFQISSVTSHADTLIDRYEIDLLIIPDAFASKAQPSAEYFVDDYVCVVDRNNPVTADDLTIERYLEMEHVAVQFEGPRVVFDDAFLRKKGYDRRSKVVVPTHSSLEHFVLDTNRIMTVQRRFAERFSESSRLKVIPTPSESPKIREIMQWNAFNATDPTLKWVIAVLCAIENDDFVEEEWRTFPPHGFVSEDEA